MDDLTAEERAIGFRRIQAYLRRLWEGKRKRTQRAKNWQLREDSPNYNPRPPPSTVVLYGLKFGFSCFPNRMIREMDLVRIIEFSLISKSCRNLVKSCKIQVIRTTVTIRSEVIVRFDLEEEGWCQLTFWRSVGERRLKAPLKVEVICFENYVRKVRSICKDQFEMVDWMEHFKTIFNYRNIDSIKFDLTSFPYNPEDLKKNFGVPSTLSIGLTTRYVDSQAILQTFLPVESLKIESYNFKGSKIPPEFLIQNFKTLKINEIVPKAVTLNNLLMINSKLIDIRSARIGSMGFHKFIKLWQQGANPQMECLFFENRTELDPTVILKGIKYTEILEDEGRWFKSSERRAEKKHVRGGMEIVRKDGVRATILIDTDRHVLEMFVWFDHCIAIDRSDFD